MKDDLILQHRVFSLDASLTEFLVGGGYCSCVDRTVARLNYHFSLATPNIRAPTKTSVQNDKPWDKRTLETNL